MKKYIFLFIAASVCFIAVFTSCKKYYSTTDTQVLQALTDTFSVQHDSDWTKSDSGYYFYTKDNIANLRTNDTNSSILDSGAVLIYLSTDTANTYELLPSNYNLGYDFIGRYGDGFVTIYAYPTSADVPPSFPVNIKIVSFPSSISYKTLNYDPNDYEEIKKAFILKE